MERLTEKDYCGYDIKGRENFDGYNTENDIEKLFGSFQKLGQLEDIEEELGIKLSVLINAVKNGIYIPFVYEYDKDTNSIGKIKEYMFIKDVAFCKSKIIFVNQYNGIPRCYYFKDYGKTWALTKEELKNE